LADGQTWVPAYLTTDNRFKAGVTYGFCVTLRPNGVSPARGFVDGLGVVLSAGAVRSALDVFIDANEEFIQDIEVLSVSDSGKEIYIRLVFQPTF